MEKWPEPERGKLMAACMRGGAAARWRQSSGERAARERRRDGRKTAERRQRDDIETA
jgi:hypothetical protein